MKLCFAVCNMMKQGLVAVFGPQADATANHIQSISDTFHIPHVETRWHYSSENKPFSINIRPHPSVLGQVNRNGLKEAPGWVNFAYHFCLNLLQKNLATWGPTF